MDDGGEATIIGLDVSNELDNDRRRRETDDATTWTEADRVPEEAIESDAMVTVSLYNMVEVTYVAIEEFY